MLLPKDFEERMREMLADEFPVFAASFDNKESYIAVRLNPQKIRDRKLLEDIIPDSSPVDWCKDGYYCSKQQISGNHPYHLAGLFYFQEPSAMSTAEAIDIDKSDFVLDLCAAPGGKATQIGAKLGEDGFLLANEIISKRASVLAENIERFGISNSIVTNEDPERLATAFPEFFDKIIVDAPCSGEGMFKKEPQAAIQWSINHTKTCALRQQHIMDCAYKMLRSGGSIIYSTCTFAPCENEGVIDYMLNKYTDLTIEKTTLSMLTGGNGSWVESSHDMSETRRIFPHLHKGEGHFVAALKKNGEPCDRKIKLQKNDSDIKSCVKLFKEFEKKALNTDIDGYFKMYADNLYLVPHGINTDKLKVVRGGLHLGVCKKNRFEPSHALLLSLKAEDFKNTVNFECNDEVLKTYLHGETIPSDINGYCAVCVNNYPIGWAKGSCGILKNHYPKYLRIN